MKKFILFSLLGCFFIGNVFADGGGGTCTITRTGAIICGTLPPVGDAEQLACFKRKGTETTPPSGYEELETGSIYSNDYWVQKSGTDCTPKKPHATKAACMKNPSKTDPYNRSCAAWYCEEGYVLYTSTKGKDIPLTSDKSKKVLRSMGLCRSRAELKNYCEINCKCNDPKKECIFNEVNVWNHNRDVPAYVGEELCICVEKANNGPKTCEEQYPDDLEKQRKCECEKKYTSDVADYEQKRACCELGKEWDEVNNTCICGNGEEWDRTTKRCVKKIVAPVDDCADYLGNPEAYACCKKDLTWDVANKTCMCPEGYIWDKDKKDCVEIKEEPCNGIDCQEYGYYVHLTCPDGTIIDDYKYYKIDKNYLKEHGYNSFAEYEAANPVPCQDRYDYDVCMQELFCKKHQEPAASAPSGNQNTSSAPQQQQPAVYKPDNNALAIANAKKVLDDFYTYAKDDENRSVWKDSEGNFNTIRLASDLTAGVVLGTVGGVVSGVVIKKKQVEKGFDALHCTVGGQSVADWGDTFNVGLR